MNPLIAALNLIIAQGCMGAFDTIYHHELRAALPEQPNAALELGIHAGRSLLYGGLFMGLAWLWWGGMWLFLLGGILLAEVVLTLWDFLVEDRTRPLPPAERVLHTIMALNGGAVFVLLCLYAPMWWKAPTRLSLVSHGWQSVVLSIFAVGVVVSGLRDAAASATLRRHALHVLSFDFGKAPQRLLITGGTGFIGQLLCEALLRQGHEITLLVRDPLKAAHQFQGKAHCVTTLADLSRDTEFDVVVNLAGERVLGPRWTAKRRDRLVASRVNTTQAIVAWIAGASRKPRLMISASAIGYYGVQRPADTTALTEDSQPQHDFLSKLCQAWEGAARNLTQYGVALAVLRFGLVLGHQGALPRMSLPFKLGLGGPIGSGRQMVSWIHVEDLVGVIAWLMAIPDSHAVEGTYNLTAPQAVTQKEFAKTLAGVVHRPAIARVPGVVVRCALGAQAMLVLEGQRVYPARLVQGGYRFRFPELEPALRDLCDVKATD
jgi:uncharacterized protein (TIGR01777 family)